MNPYSQESRAEQEARRAEDLEILRRARQKRPAPNKIGITNIDDPGERKWTTHDYLFGLLIFLVIILAIALFVPGGGR
jgi:hypothetical protein